MKTIRPALLIVFFIPLMAFGRPAPSEEWDLPSPYEDLEEFFFSDFDGSEEKSRYAENDDARNLVDFPERFLKSPLEMDERGFQEGQADVKPWSGYYWPIYKGSVAKRYQDPEFPKKEKKWKKYYKYYQEYPADYYVRKGKIHLLSPAEKYDLLVGDPYMTLTQKNWDKGRRYYENDHDIHQWYGICHGWASASHMEKAPKHSVTVKSVNGRHTIRFDVNDLKALASLLWAKSLHARKFIGKRCHDDSPSTGRNGRLQTEFCFNTNPGTWHMAVVNQINVARRPFNADVEYHSEIQNRPVYSYKIKYFNPRTRKRSSYASQVMIPMREHKYDNYYNYRSKAAAYVVGVEMKVTYVDGNDTWDDQNVSALDTKTYLYDLELDDHYSIIGGEWHKKDHPDFLWGPRRNTPIRATYENEAEGSWDSRYRPLPESWAKAARKSSGKLQPLAKIVKTLIEFSQYSN